MKEQGHVIVIFLFCLIVMALPTQSLLNRATRHDRVVLQAAKMAVIAWAVARYPGREGKQDIRPGEMVVPDKDVPGVLKKAGIQDSNAGIGRLPWQTLGIPPLLDAHGEHLWYMVSSRFRDNGSDMKALHCNGLDQLRVSASGYKRPVASKGIAAVVIAPHRALKGQQRETQTQQKQWYQYIESAHPNAQYRRTDKETYRHLMQGQVIKNGQVIMNDQLLPIECQILQRALIKRRENKCE
jgi:hypothetical protein